VVSHGFLDTGGSFTTIDFPGGGDTNPIGINNSGQIVGYYDDASGIHGFLDTAGSFTTIDFPGAYRTFAEGINNSGQIVGIYYMTPLSSGQGFLDTGGSFTTIDYPGASFSGASGINDSGQILGEFGGSHGYLATPVATPEPPTLITLATCLVTVFGIAWYRQPGRTHHGNFGTRGTRLARHHAGDLLARVAYRQSSRRQAVERCDGGRDSGESSGPDMIRNPS
jgi:uncharacterized membrane protein